MKEAMGDKQRLLHIIEAIKEIEGYTNSVTFSEFLANSMMRFASVKQIEIIGEAVNYISTATKNKFSDVEWGQITGMRHILVHEYFGIDATLVWQVIIKDVPKLKEKINVILSEI